MSVVRSPVSIMSPQQQIAALTWTVRRRGVIEFRGVLGRHHRVIWGSNRAELMALAERMSEDRA